MEWNFLHGLTILFYVCGIDRTFFFFQSRWLRYNNGFSPIFSLKQSTTVIHLKQIDAEPSASLQRAIYFFFEFLTQVWLFVHWTRHKGLGKDSEWVARRARPRLFSPELLMSDSPHFGRVRDIVAAKSLTAVNEVWWFCCLILCEYVREMKTRLFTVYKTSIRQR